MWRLRLNSGRRFHRNERKLTMSLQNPVKGSFQSRVGGLLVGAAALLAMSAFPAAAEDQGPSVQGVTELSAAQKMAAEAQSASIKAEADNFDPGNIRFYDQTQLDEKGNPKPGAIPRLLRDDEFDAKLDEASRGRIHLWYISGGFALNAKAEKIPEGIIIKLIGPLLTAARQNRRETLENEEKEATARNAADIQGGQAAIGRLQAKILNNQEKCDLHSVASIVTCGPLVDSAYAGPYKGRPYEGQNSDDANSKESQSAAASVSDLARVGAKSPKLLVRSAPQKDDKNIVCVLPAGAVVRLLGQRVEDAAHKITFVQVGFNRQDHGTMTGWISQWSLEALPASSSEGDSPQICFDPTP
jgi:hypothetical protein